MKKELLPEEELLLQNQQLLGNISSNPEHAKDCKDDSHSQLEYIDITGMTLRVRHFVPNFITSFWPRSKIVPKNTNSYSVLLGSTPHFNNCQ